MKYFAFANGLNETGATCLNIWTISLILPPEAQYELNTHMPYFRYLDEFIALFIVNEIQ